MNAAELQAFLGREFPQVAGDFIVEAAGEETVIRLVVAERHLRPGGTVSGPSMFALADVGHDAGEMPGIDALLAL